MSLREKLIKTGAKVVSHGRYVMFQIAEVRGPRPTTGTADARMRGAKMAMGPTNSWRSAP